MVGGLSDAADWVHGAPVEVSMAAQKTGPAHQPKTDTHSQAVGRGRRRAAGRETSKQGASLAAPPPPSSSARRSPVVGDSSEDREREGGRERECLQCTFIYFTELLLRTDERTTRSSGE